MSTETTLVRFPLDEYREIPTKNIKFVGGEGGVFATYQENDQIHFLSGNDGAWWLLATYHIDWCNGISKNIYSYCTQGRIK